nr:hypothetical protein CparaKRNrm1_p006 [Cryptomonas paramecium]
MVISNKKYFWKKKAYAFLVKPNGESLKFLNKGILMTSIPIGFLKIIGNRRKIIFRKKTRYFLLASGNVVVYEKEKLVINIKNIKFEIKKRQDIFHKNVGNIIQNHRILIDVGTSVRFLELLML